MGSTDEFSLSVRLFLRGYRWRRIDPVPHAPLRRPLSASRLALVSSAGLVGPGQEPFDDAIRGGDCGWREIAADSDPAALRECHRSESWDHTGVAADANLAFPLERVRELAASGEIGSVNHRHFSIMGSITATGRLVRDTAPEIAAACVADEVDAVLLVPV